MGTSIVRRFFYALGPAIIVASVVLGPGSISLNSQVGATYGYSMIWVLALAAVLMACMVALAGRLGVALQGTMCEELAARLGRPFAAIVGLTLFCVCAGFQFSNNVGVLAALEPWLAPVEGQAAQTSLWTIPNGVLVALNVLLIVFLFGFKKLYRPIEWLMMFLVGLMIVGFLGNFLYLLIAGANTAAPVEPVAEAGAAPDTMSVLALIGLVSTTFSIAGAFYQAYLVREKGWTLDDADRGIIDSVAGISVLGGISLVIMLTAAMCFHGRAIELKSAADMAAQLEPLFGRAAVALFSLGFFAGAFSSFLVNAMIGGAMLSDGLGLGGRMDGLATKLFTTLALLTGMLVAILVPPDNLVGLIIFSQAMVMIGFPLLGASIVYLATRKDLTGERAIPKWMIIGGAVGLLFAIACALRAGVNAWERLQAFL